MLQPTLILKVRCFFETEIYAFSCSLLCGGNPPKMVSQFAGTHKVSEHLTDALFLECSFVENILYVEVVNYGVVIFHLDLKEGYVECVIDIDEDDARTILRRYSRKPPPTVSCN